MPEKPTTPPPQIFVIAAKIPLNPTEGQKQTINVHQELGFWTKEHLAALAAKRRSLHVIELTPGEEIT